MVGEERGKEARRRRAGVLGERGRGELRIYQEVRYQRR